MRTVQDVLFGVAGQSVVFDAPEGRPSSVTSGTVHLWDAADTTVELTLAPTIETDPNTTTDAVAGAAQADPKRVPLTATTGAAIGRVYLLTGADLRKEWIDVEEVIAADAVYARHPLHNDYASGATLQSTRITAAIDNTWAADLSNLLDDLEGNPGYRVRWVYVVAGVTYVADSYFNLTRYGARHGVLPRNVDDMVPGWIDSLPIDHRIDQGSRLIAEAYREVKIDLHAIKLEDTGIAEAEVLDSLVRYKAVELTEYARYLSSPNRDDARYRAAKETYDTRRGEFVQLVNNVPIRDATGAAAPAVAISLTRR